MVHFSFISVFVLTTRLTLAQTTTAAIFYPYGSQLDLEGYVYDIKDDQTTYSLSCVDTSSDSLCTPTPFQVVAYQDNVEFTSSNIYEPSGTPVTFTELATCSLHSSGSQSSAVCNMNFRGWGTNTDIPTATVTTLLPPFVATQYVMVTPAPSSTTAPATASATGSGSTSGASTASTSTSTGGMPAVTGNNKLVIGGAAIAALAMLV